LPIRGRLACQRLELAGRYREWASCSSAFGGGCSVLSHGPFTKNASMRRPLVGKLHSVMDSRSPMFSVKIYRAGQGHTFHLPVAPLRGVISTSWRPANERFGFLCVLSASVVRIWGCTATARGFAPGPFRLPTMPSSCPDESVRWRPKSSLSKGCRRSRCSR